MNNELLVQKNWWQRNWKWLTPITIVVVLAAVLFISLTGGHLGSFAQAYSDTELYAGALEKAHNNGQVKTLLGELQPIDKMAILEGEVEYSNHNKNVDFTVRVNGSKGKAVMDVSAERVQNTWEYQKINIRIKNPPENKQTIQVVY